MVRADIDCRITERSFDHLVADPIGRNEFDARRNSTASVPIGFIADAQRRKVDGQESEGSRGGNEGEQADGIVGMDIILIFYIDDVGKSHGHSALLVVFGFGGLSRKKRGKKKNYENRTMQEQASNGLLFFFR